MLQSFEKDRAFEKIFIVTVEFDPWTDPSKTDHCYIYLDLCIEIKFENDFKRPWIIIEKSPQNLSQINP